MIVLIVCYVHILLVFPHADTSLLFSSKLLDLNITFFSSRLLDLYTSLQDYYILYVSFLGLLVFTFRSFLYGFFLLFLTYSSYNCMLKYFTCTTIPIQFNVIVIRTCAAFEAKFALVSCENIHAHWHVDT